MSTNEAALPLPANFGSSELPFPRGEDALTSMLDYLAGAPRQNLGVRIEAMRTEDRRLIFGEMAMSLAGIASPEDAYTPEWYHNVSKALGILGEPAAFAKAMEAPYADALVKTSVAIPDIAPVTPKASLDSYRPARVELSRKERKEYRKLQEVVSKHGYFEHDLLPADRVFQLVYGGAKQENEDPIVIKVRTLANTKGFPVQEYSERDGKGAFKDPLGPGFVMIPELFEVLAVQSGPDNEKTLTVLDRDYVRIGSASPSSSLNISHRYRMEDKIVPGHEKLFQTSKTMNLPNKLLQVYYGNSWEYPLFK